MCGKNGRGSGVSIPLPFLDNMYYRDKCCASVSIAPRHSGDNFSVLLVASLRCVCPNPVRFDFQVHSVQIEQPPKSWFYYYYTASSFSGLCYGSTGHV